MPENPQTPGEPGNGAPEITVTQMEEPVLAPPPSPLLDDDDAAEELLDDDAIAAYDDTMWRDPDPLADDALLFADDDGSYDDPVEDAFADVIEIAGSGIAAPSTVTDERLRRLEAAARELAAAEVTREGRRVRRKVTAATTGAGAAGFIPILLQMVDVLSLDPTIAATVTASASLIGAFAAGWLTPERQPPLPTPTAQALMGLGDAER